MLVDVLVDVDVEVLVEELLELDDEVEVLVDDEVEVLVELEVCVVVGKGSSRADLTLQRRTAQLVTCMHASSARTACAGHERVGTRGRGRMGGLLFSAKGQCAALIPFHS